MPEKTLGNTDVNGTHKNVPDVVVYGDGDTFALLCKASSQQEGWLKSTKVANIPGGALVQVTTQQRNPDGSYAVAEALTYAPGVWIDKTQDPPRMVAIADLHNQRLNEAIAQVFADVKENSAVCP